MTIAVDMGRKETKTDKHHIKMACFGKGGEAVKMLIVCFNKSSFVTHFVQTCSLITFSNGMMCVMQNYNCMQKDKLGQWGKSPKIDFFILC